MKKIDFDLEKNLKAIEIILIVGILLYALLKWILYSIKGIDIPKDGIIYENTIISYKNYTVVLLIISYVAMILLFKIKKIQAYLKIIILLIFIIISIRIPILNVHSDKYETFGKLAMDVYRGTYEKSYNIYLNSIK